MARFPVNQQPTPKTQMKTTTTLVKSLVQSAISRQEENKSITHPPGAVLVFMPLLLVAMSMGHAHADTIGYWRFEEGAVGSAATAPGSVMDSSGHGLNATPFGGRSIAAASPLMPVP